MADASDVLRVHPSTLHREIEGETVLLQLDSGEYFGLDPVGTRMFQLLSECGDLAKVEQKLLEEFDVDSATLHADLNRFLSELLDRQLVTRGD